MEIYQWIAYIIPWKGSCLARIVGGHIIGPFFIDANLNDINFLALLPKNIPI